MGKLVRTLECSSAGNTDYSALFAKVEVFGIIDTIEKHYQLCKRINGESPSNWQEGKGQEPDYIWINGYNYEAKDRAAFYELMWVKYLDNHLNLVIGAKMYDEFTDRFRGNNPLVCQADTIRDYIKNGRNYIIDKHKDFLRLLEQNSNCKFFNK